MQVSKTGDNSTSLQAARDNKITVNNGLSLRDVESFFNVLIKANMSEITTEVSSRLNNNLSSILSRSKRLLEEKAVESAQNISLRSLKNIVNDGMFCDDKVCQEYYAGILAASYKENNDSGLYYTNIVARLTSRALLVHYYLYSCALLYSRHSKEEISLYSRFVINEDAFYDLFGGVLDVNTFEINEVLSNLNSEKLLDAYALAEKKVAKKKYFTEVDGDCFMFQITDRGRFLYLWANGLSNIEWYDAKKECCFFPDHLELQVPGFCKSVITEGDAYLIAEQKMS